MASRLPASTTPPSFITTMRSHMVAITPKSCDTMMTESPASSRRVLSSPKMLACTVTSSAVVGSSAMSTSGSQASAAAIITRCFIPPESSWG